MSEIMQEPTGNSSLGAPRPAEKGAATGPGVIDAKHEAFRNYKIIGKDDGEFIRTAEQLLEGSKLLMNRDLMVANLTAVFKRIADWCQTNRESLKAALITLKPGKVSLFFVATAERYDVELDAKMTELEVGLGGSAGVGSVESFQIPERSVEHFVGREALVLWQR